MPAELVQKTILGVNVLDRASKQCNTPLLINMPQPLCSSTLLVPIKQIAVPSAT